MDGWYEEDGNVEGTVFINMKPQDPAEKATLSKMDPLPSKDEVIVIQTKAEGKRN